MVEKFVSYFFLLFGFSLCIGKIVMCNVILYIACFVVELLIGEYVFIKIVLSMEL